MTPEEERAQSAQWAGNIATIMKRHFPSREVVVFPCNGAETVGISYYFPGEDFKQHREMCTVNAPRFLQWLKGTDGRGVFEMLHRKHLKQQQPQKNHV